MMENIQDYMKINKEHFLEDYIRLLEIPSISPGEQYPVECREAAELLRRYLVDAGAEGVCIIETDINPLVHGEKMVSPERPTVLVYGHYDVMPADLDDGWLSDPFMPRLSDGKVFARGAQDNKGQLFVLLKAFEYANTENILNCNLKFIFEGNEETGSTPFCNVLKTDELQEKLKADVVLISDTDLVNNETPAVVIGLRGAAIWNIEVTGPKIDLHSGLYGGVVVNPLNELVRVLGALHDEQGKVTLPGFYDDVREYSKNELADFALQPFDENEILSISGVELLDGEDGFSPMERMSIRPTLEFTGLAGGYTGEGIKAIIPSSAKAKVFARLVPYQDPEKIINSLISYMKSSTNPAVHCQVDPGPRVCGFTCDTDNQFFRTIEKACLSTFGRSPVKLRMGGSIGIVPAFQEYLRADSLLIGFGLGSDNIHGPNEHFELARMWKGIETIAAFFQYLGEV